MAWHTITQENNSTPSTCSQEQVGGFSLTSYLDTIQSEPVRSNPTPETSCSSDKEMESYQSSQSGMTSAHWTGDPGGERFLFCMEDFLVKTSAHKERTTEKNWESMETAQAYGQNISESLKKCGLSSSLPKIPRSYELGDLEQSSKGFPLWGIMHGGVASEVVQSVRITRERDSGYLPTVLATDWKGGTTAIRKDKGKQRLDQWRDYVKVKYSLTYPHPTHSELRMGWPEGWTDLKPLEMVKYLKWRHSHGKF